MIGMPIGTLEPCHKTKGSIGKLWFVCSTRIQNQNVNWVQTPAVLGRKGKGFICTDFLRFISVHTGLKSRRLKILCFPPEFEMKFHIYVVPKCCCYDEDSVANLAFIRGQRWLVQIHVGRISWRISFVLLKEPNNNISSAKMAMTRKKFKGKVLKCF